VLALVLEPEPVLEPVLAPELEPELELELAPELEPELELELALDVSLVRFIAFKLISCSLDNSCNLSQLLRVSSEALIL
jgi:hypothetical protein